MFDNFMNILRDVLQTGIVRLNSFLIIMTSILFAIDFIYTMAMSYTSEIKKTIVTVIQKVMRLAITIAIIKILPSLISSIIKFSFNIGYMFWDESYVAGKLPSLDHIWQTMYKSIENMIKTASTNTPFGTKILLWFYSLILCYIIFRILSELILSYVTILLIGAIGSFMLVFSVIDLVKSYAESYYRALLKACLRLMIAVSLTGIFLSIIKTVSTIANGEMKDANILPFILTTALLGLLIPQSQAIAGMIIDGSGDFGMGLGGMALATVGVVGANFAGRGVKGATAIGGAVTGAVSAGMQSVKTGQSVTDMIKSVGSGAKDGAGKALNSKALNTYLNAKDKTVEIASDIKNLRAGKYLDKLFDKLEGDYSKKIKENTTEKDK